MNTWLRRLAQISEKKTDPLFRVPGARQAAYLAGLGEARDDGDRSFKQYKAQNWLRGPVFSAGVNLAALPLFLMRYLTLPRQGRASERIEPTGLQTLAIVWGENMKRLIPEELAAGGTLATVDGAALGLRWSRDESRFFFRHVLARHPVSFLFWLKMLIKIGQYRWIFERYAPRNLLTFSEYSFTSSLLTAYCEARGVRHLNAMHGEKLFFIRDAYFRFHRCYVWDEHYAALFEKLKAAPGQFRLSQPAGVRFAAADYPRRYDVVYYLGDETDETLRRIAELLAELSRLGQRVAVRPHPIYTPPARLAAFFPAELRETPQTPIEQSVLQTGRVLALYSTVLYQAYLNGVPVLIDDLSRPDAYHRLQEMDYIMLAKPHVCLSCWLEELRAAALPDNAGRREDGGTEWVGGQGRQS